MCETGNMKKYPGVQGSTWFNLVYLFCIIDVCITAQNKKTCLSSLEGNTDALYFWQRVTFPSHPWNHSSLYFKGVFFTGIMHIIQYYCASCLSLEFLLLTSEFL